MDSTVKALAEAYSVPLSNRSCYRSYLWDGKTLATMWQREVWSEDCTTLERVCAPEPIEPFSLVHEIAHYVVADEVEREFPEYGCYVLGDFNSNPIWISDHPYSSQAYKLSRAVIEGVLNDDEQSFREACADFLGVYWCDLLEIPVKDDWRPVNKYSKHDSKLYGVAWRAIVWLREKGLFPQEMSNDPTPEDGYTFIAFIKGRDWKTLPNDQWDNSMFNQIGGETYLGTRVIDGSVCNVWRSAHCRWYIAQVKRG